ncbi:MYO15A, partial [Symbiodinium sp. CCMP2456]
RLHVPEGDAGKVGHVALPAVVEGPHGQDSGRGDSLCEMHQAECCERPRGIHCRHGARAASLQWSPRGRPHSQARLRGAAPFR